MNSKQQNLIIFCSDEMRGDCVGFMGNKDVRTPHLDALAEESVVFEQMMAVFPKCVPARASLMTGRYCHTEGWRTVQQTLSDGQTTLLERLRERGYETALFGKNHCWHPNVIQREFDFTSHTEPMKSMLDDVPRIRKHEPDPNGASPMDLEDGWDYIGCQTRFASDEVFAEQAVQFLSGIRDRSKPFFMQVNIEAPHPVYGVEEPYFSMYDRAAIQAWPHRLPVNAPLPMVKQREYRTGLDENEAAVREIQAVYYGMISKVDALIGKMMQAVREQGLEDDTIIMFWSDHGDFAGQYGLVEKWDTTFSDCLLHVPFLLKIPGKQGKARVSGLADTTDIAPTLCDLLGLDPLPGMHGTSLVAAMERGSTDRHAVYADGGHEENMIHRAAAELPSGLTNRGGLMIRPAKQETYKFCPNTMARSKMVRTDKYKLVIRLQGGNELYNLQDDPWEMNNRWGDVELAEVTAELMLLIINWCLLTDTDAPYLPKFTA